MLGLGWLWASPLAIGAVATGGVAAIVLERAIAALAESADVRSEIHALAARLAAESAAIDYVATGGAAVEHTLDAGNGLLVQTSISPMADSAQLRLSARVSEQSFEFLFSQLAGGAPVAFGRPLTVGPDSVVPPDWIAGNEVVREVPPSIADGTNAGAIDAAGAVSVTDAGLALLRLPAGTDRADFVLGGGRAQRTPNIPECGVVHVFGNLWVDSTGAPLELSLRRDLTIVVHGNVYLGRSVLVSGPGHLTIATAGDGGTSFVDKDGNGRWSPGEVLLGADAFSGPVEGAGNVYLGMPREPAQPIDLQLGMLVTGALHVGAEVAQVHGPLVLAGAGVQLGRGTGQLVCTGTRLPSLRRSALPGFAAIGSPRPGPLLPLHEEPLYPAAPAR